MRKKNIYLLSTFIILIFSIFSLYAENTNIIRLDQIRPGMKGYGLTVFKGIKVEKFDIEVISVLKDIRPRSGLILVKLKGNIIDKAGVIAGMSGTPIYINNKLIGALAYSWTFSKEPFAGVTPIEDMLKIFNFSTTNLSFNFEPKNRAYAQVDKGNHSLQMIKTPLIFHGASQNMIDLFKDNLMKMNFIPITSAGNSSDYEVPEKFIPGSAVGVNLITGDMNVSAIGTVTYVDKEKMLIFGHPMFQSGSTDMPLSHVYIHTVLPSIYMSVKMGTCTRIDGRDYQDQLAGVAGILNEKAKMIPVKINLDYFDQKDSFNYNIIRSYYYLPSLLTMSVYDSLEMVGGMLEKNTLHFTYNIKFNNNKTIKIKDTLSALATSDTIRTSMLYLLDPVEDLLVNKFEDVQINDIDVQIELDNKIKIAEIKSITASKKSFEPGETLKLKIKLTPYQSKSFYKTISIILPYNLPEKKITLYVSSDQERQYVDYILSPGKYRAQSLDHLVELYASLAKSTDLSVWALVRDKSIIAHDYTMDNLPSSYYSILRDSLETGMQKSIMQIKNKIPVDYIITGSATLSIQIKKELH